MSNPASRRSFNAALRRLRKAIEDTITAAGDDPEMLGEFLEMDTEWRAAGRRVEEQLTERDQL